MSSSASTKFVNVWEVIQLVNTTKGLDKTAKLCQYGSRTLDACLSDSSSWLNVLAGDLSTDFAGRAVGLETHLNRVRKTMRLFKWVKELQSLSKNLTSKDASLPSSLIAIGGDISNTAYYMIEQLIWGSDVNLLRVKPETREHWKTCKTNTAVFRMLFRFLSLASIPSGLLQEEKELLHEMQTISQAKCAITPEHDYCNCFATFSARSHARTLTDFSSSTDSYDETPDSPLSNSDSIDTSDSDDASEQPDGDNLDSPRVSFDSIFFNSSDVCGFCQLRAFKEKQQQETQRIAEALRKVQTKKFYLLLDSIELCLNFVLLGAQRNWFRASNFVTGMCGMAASLVGLYRFYLTMTGCASQTQSQNTTANANTNDKEKGCDFSVCSTSGDTSVCDDTRVMSDC